MGITFTVSDGGLQQSPFSNSNYRVVIGVATSGTVNTIIPINSTDDVKTNLVSGPLAEACAYNVVLGGPGVLAVRVTPTGHAAVTTAVAVTGTSPTLTVAGTPIDMYDVRVQYTAGGIVGTSKFIYSVDGGNTWMPEQVTAASVALYEPSYAGTGTFGATGITITTPAGTYVTGDTAAFRTYPGHYIAGDCTTAMSTLDASLYDFHSIHFAGNHMATSTDATNLGSAATFANAIATPIASMQTNKRFIRAYYELPDIYAGGQWTSAYDSSAVTALSGVTNVRLRQGVGTCDLVSGLGSGLLRRRNAVWPYVARLAKNIGANRYSADVAWVGSPFGPLDGVRRLWRDERAMQTAGTLRALALTSFPAAPGNAQGYYANSSVTLASSTSDYAYDPLGIVMDLACKTANATVQQFLNSDLDTNVDGTLTEVQCAAIDSVLDAALKQALRGQVPVQQSFCVVSRTTNIVSTGRLDLRIRFTPKGYARSIAVDIGYQVRSAV